MQQNSTVAFAQAFAAFDLGPGDVILTSRADYASNQIMYLALARRRGVEVRPRARRARRAASIPRRCASWWRRRRPPLLALTWIPTNSGLVQPAEAIGEICRDAGVPYILDACQAVGQMPVDVSRLHCDYLAGTAAQVPPRPRGAWLPLRLRPGARGRRLPMDRGHARRHLDRPRRLRPHARCAPVRELGVFLRAGAGLRRRGGVRAPGRGRDRAASGAGRWPRYARERLGDDRGVRVLDRGPDALRHRHRGAGRPSRRTRSSSPCGRAASTPAHPTGTTR